MMPSVSASWKRNRYLAMNIPSTSGIVVAAAPHRNRPMPCVLRPLTNPGPAEMPTMAMKMLRPTIWFMNSVGLNIFIAIVGISAGPGFVNGLKTQGMGLFIWGAVATTVPLLLGMFIAKYLFRFHDALTLGIVSGARTTTASLGLVCDQAKSQIPALGYTVTYAVGNTLLTIWGMVIIMILS